MNARPISPPRRRARPERGFVLVTGLLFLVVVTMLGIALFRSSGLMERLSANTRDKQRAFESAQAALQYGEWYLGNAAVPAATACTTSTGKTVATLHVCTEALSASRDTLAALAWAPNGFTYQPGALTVQANGGLTTNQQDVNYQALPGVYLVDLGTSSDGKSELYQVTAYGYGGNANTTSVVQSTYKVTSATTCLSCTP